MGKLPTYYRKSADSLVTVDSIDNFSGVSYINLFLCGGRDSTGDIFFLTNNGTIIADNDNIRQLGGALDIDFDITLNQTVKVAAADAIVKLLQTNNNPSTTDSFSVTVKHVSKAAVESSIGTITLASMPYDAGDFYNTRTAKIALTAKTFKPGEKLRVTVATVDGGGAGSGIYIDPSGFYAQTESGQTYSSSSHILIPIKAPN